MKLTAHFLVALVAFAHIGFLVLEMFFWTTPYALRAFNMTPEFAQASSVLAANQGLYNGFLAAGLLWGMAARENGSSIKIFFLTCVIMAGVFGAVTTGKMTILYAQAAPAALALLFVMLSRNRP